MLLTSPSFEEGGTIPKKFTCDGGNINPELIIQNVPEEARSLALIMHDPDAPADRFPGGFTHWVVWNIPPQTMLIKQESIPAGSREGMNTRSAGYTGPCPPSGTHRYEFRLYALDITLDIQENSGKAELESFMEGHVLEEVKLTGLYSRA